MSPEVLKFAQKLAEGARAKALEDHRRLEAIRQAKSDSSSKTPQKQ